MTEITITQHALKKLKKRLNAKKSNIYKIVANAFLDGIEHHKTKGALKRYISNIFLKYGTANNIRIYNEYIFFFRNSTLITVYKVPSSFKKHLILVK